VTMSVRCRSCSGRVDSAARFCRHCGQVIESAPAGLAEASDLVNATEPVESGTTDVVVASVGPRDHWPSMRWLFCFYAAMLSVSVLMTIATALKFGSGAQVDACGATGMAIVITSFACFSPTPLAPLLRWPSMTAKTTAVLLLGAVVWGMGIEGYFFLIRALGVQFVQFWPDFDSAGWPWWSVFLIVCVVPGVFEEVAFRGLVYDGLRPILGPRDALVVQAMAFAVLHLAPLIFVSHFFIGLGLGMLRDRSRGLLVPMLAHTAWNSYVIGSEWWSTHHALIIP
jgi:membrane protease YdiL (CAAX protease family)